MNILENWIVGTVCSNFGVLERADLILVNGGVGIAGITSTLSPLKKSMIAGSTVMLLKQLICYLNEARD